MSVFKFLNFARGKNYAAMRKKSKNINISISPDFGSDIGSDIGESDIGESCRNITLQMVISNAKSCTLFLEQLAIQLNTNCLLSFIEMTQYQKALIREKKIATNAINHKMMFLPSRPINIEIDGKDYRTKAFKLFKKYIAENSELEISISNGLRNKVSNTVVTNYLLSSPTDIFQVFDECKYEMFMLLQIAFIKLKQTEKWTQITQIFD